MRPESSSEPDKKPGLSRAAILKRAQRQYVSEAELQQCRANPDLAFTIRGDDWIVCLECRQLLKQIRDKGWAPHLREHGITVDQYREGRYGKNRSLICNALATKLRVAAQTHGRLVPDQTRKYLRSPAKGRTFPPEWHRAHAEQGRRTAGTRDIERDTEILRLWLLEAQPIEVIAQKTECSAGYPYKILQRIFGIRVKQRIVFSRGEPVTDLWINALCERFGLSKPEIGELLEFEPGVVKWLQQLGAAGKNRALTPETAGPLVEAEGMFLEILANADTSPDDRADYLCAVEPELAAKRDGASLAISIVRDSVGLKDVCAAAQNGDRRARIALAFVPSAAAWLQTLDNSTRSLPVSELVREHFLPAELKTPSPFLLRKAIERDGPAETKPTTIRGIIRNAFRVKELEERRGGRPDKRKRDAEAAKLREAGVLPRQIAQRLDPDGFRDNPDKATEKIRTAIKRYNRDT